MSKSIKNLVLAAIALVAGVVANAQVTTSSIAGRVVDAEGPVAGAAVIATYTPTGSNYYTVTDANGSYRINSVVAGGPYTLSVEMLGYQKVEFTEVYAPLTEVVTVNATLTVESLGLDAAVFVADGNLSSMNIQRSGAGTTVSQKTMNALPTADRTMNDVLKLTPQASVTSNGLAVGGGNYRSSYVTVDGAAFNNAFGIGSNLPAGGTPISLDALDQMSINITPFDVRQSGFTGGAINAVTKSGTNDFHASVYNYYKSDKITGYKVDGNDVSKSDYLDNVTGISVGGPIVKNKLFLFVNFEYALDNRPGSSYRVRENDSQAWGKGTQYVRPTEAFMEEVKSYLASEYGYNPGRYQGYSLKTPDWKFLARLDWNINDNHRFNVRYSQTMNKNSNAPSSSVNPISPNPYDRNNYGRTSMYAQFFESSRYYQEQNFMSLAAELNSRFMEGRLNNLFRVTWSHQYEPRSFEGGNFPTVDILENTVVDGNDTRAVITSFGPDPFTYGNLRDVNTIVATDELSYRMGIHNIIGGLQFEYNNTKNGFMQGGLGYYVYDSWDSFKNNATPVAFAITHSNRDDLKQVYPAFDYMQASWYLQDEVTFSDYFKLTAGLRFELPFYPEIDGNENKEFTALANANPNSSLYGHKTSDMPMSRVNISPRIGFNWDVLKDRSIVLRGGSGIYTGRIPFVWIVSVAGNSNCLQAQFISTDGTGAPKFHTNVDDILKDLYGGSFKAQDLYAPTAATVLDKKLKMPTTWKTSLAADFRLPWGIKGTLEGIYNYDLTSVYVDKLGLAEVDGVQMPGEPEKRKSFKSEGIKNSLGKTVNPYLIYNVNDLHGYYYSLTAQLSKDFPFGLSLMAAYTYSKSKVLSDAVGDQITSAYNTMTYNVNGSKTPELGYGTYVSPNRLIASASYRIRETKNLATTISLFYEGYNHGYVGNYSYTRYSYTIGSKSGDYMNSLTGDGGAISLAYLPTDAELASMPFADEENKAEFKKFLQTDSYAKNHRGEYAERGGIVMPWQSRFNVKIAQDIMIPTAKQVHTLQISADINNVANLINDSWGNTKQLKKDQILTWDKAAGTYTFSAPTWNKYNNIFSTWNMMISVKYSF